MVAARKQSYASDNTEAIMKKLSSRSYQERKLSRRSYQENKLAKKKLSRKEASKEESIKKNLSYIKKKTFHKRKKKSTWMKNHAQ